MSALGSLLGLRHSSNHFSSSISGNPHNSLTSIYPDHSHIHSHHHHHHTSSSHSFTGYSDYPTSINSQFATSACTLRHALHSHSIVGMKTDLHLFIEIRRDDDSSSSDSVQQGYQPDSHHSFHQDNFDGTIQCHGIDCVRDSDMFDLLTGCIPEQKLLPLNLHTADWLQSGLPADLSPLVHKHLYDHRDFYHSMIHLSLNDFCTLVAAWKLVKQSQADDDNSASSPASESSSYTASRRTASPAPSPDAGDISVDFHQLVQSVWQLPNAAALKSRSSAKVTSQLHSKRYEDILAYCEWVRLYGSTAPTRAQTELSQRLNIHPNTNVARWLTAQRRKHHRHLQQQSSPSISPPLGSFPANHQQYHSPPSTLPLDRPMTSTYTATSNQTSTMYADNADNITLQLPCECIERGERNAHVHNTLSTTHDLPCDVAELITEYGRTTWDVRIIAAFDS